MLSKRTVSFILTSILLSTFSAFAQNEEVWVRGLRFGCDVSRFGLKLFQSDREAMEFSFDTEVKPNVFYTLESGFEKTNLLNNRITYNSDGFYGRLGIDKNILKRKYLTSRDIVFVGARYGFYQVNQKTSSFDIPGKYWSDTVSGSYPSKTLYGHWLEVAFGLKVEVVKNLYLGASLRGKVLLFATKSLNYPYYMPGFGDGANKANFAINYSIYYQIPLMKVKTKPKEAPKKPAPKN
jgi:hypothetical protein